MKKVDITPEAYDDLEGLKERLDESFGVEKEKEILKAIFKDMKHLTRYPKRISSCLNAYLSTRCGFALDICGSLHRFLYLYAGKITGTNAKT